MRSDGKGKKEKFVFRKNVKLRNFDFYSREYEESLKVMRQESYIMRFVQR